MKEYSRFHDGYSQATLKFVDDLEVVIDFYEQHIDEASKENILEGIKDRINAYLIHNIARNGVRVDTNTDRVWLQKSTIITDKVKDELRTNMMCRE